MNKISLLLLIATTSLSSLSQNNFAFDLFANMPQENNILFSPSSIKTAFAMAYEGANEKTQEELEKVFGFDAENTAFLAELAHLKNVTNISNSIWILNNYEVLKSYTDTIESRFDAAPNYTNFNSDPSGSAKKINTWIEESTNGMIKDMLKPSDVSSLKLALVNAIYFKQDWKYTFDKEKTTKETFTNHDGTTSEIDMMRALRSYRAFTGTNAKIIELPYDDDKTSMVIILPNDIKKYALTNMTYNGLMQQLQQQKVDLQLPKFTFETPTTNLIPFLTKLGINSAFSNAADFSGIRTQKDLKIGTVLHKAKIIVNEEGTEAAAVTVIGMVTTTSVGPPPAPIMKIHVDKPFYYFIKDNETGTILFMGKMNKML